MEGLLSIIHQDTDIDVLSLGCRAMVALLNGGPAMQARFLEIHAAERCIDFLKKTTCGSLSDQDRRIAEVLSVIVAACRKCEPAKRK